VLLGSGTPLPAGTSARLVLADQKTLPRSGIVVLSFSVPGGTSAPPIRYVKSVKAKSKGRARVRAVTKRTRRR
jgi:hypothetical protein